MRRHFLCSIKTPINPYGAHYRSARKAQARGSQEKATRIDATRIGSTLRVSHTAEVTSDNVVGYTKVSLERGLTIIGQSFAGYDGAIADIQTIKADGLNALGGDFISLWDGSSYTDYCYYPGETADINGDGVDAWGDLDWVSVNVEIPAGTGMWISAEKDATITFKGEVGNSTEVPFSRGLNLLTSPQPCKVNLQQVTATGLNALGGDFISIWNGTEYEDYCYYPGETADINGDGTDAWGDLDWMPVEVEIPVGVGFWLSAESDGVLTFSNALDSVSK